MKTVCYRIKPVGELPDAISCLHCRSRLRGEEIGCSQAGIEFAENMTIPIIETKLFRCPYCGWWAVMEQRSGDYELVNIYKEAFIVMANAEHEPDAALEQGTTQQVPWEQALADINCWEYPDHMSLKDVSAVLGSGSHYKLTQPESPTSDSSETAIKLICGIFIVVIVFLSIAVMSS